MADKLMFFLHRAHVINNIGEVYHHNIFEVDYSIVVQDNGQPVHITVNQQ